MGWGWSNLFSYWHSREGEKPCELKMGVANSIRAIRSKQSLTVALRENLANRICELKSLRSAIWSWERPDLLQSPEMAGPGIFTKNAEKRPKFWTPGIYPQNTPKIYPKNTPKIPKMPVLGIFSVFSGYFSRGSRISARGVIILREERRKKRPRHDWTTVRESETIVKIKFALFRGEVGRGQGGNLSKTLFFMGNVMTIQFWLSVKSPALILSKNSGVFLAKIG